LKPPTSPAPTYATRLSAGGAFAVNGLFVAALLYLGDKHPGIRTSCQDLYFLQDGYCDGSGWACNELGILLAERFDNPNRAAMSFERACQLLFSAGCDNAGRAQGAMYRRDAPTAADYPLILRGSKGPLPERQPAELLAPACDQGWPGTCG
jgi:hypothetical protein